MVELGRDNPLNYRSIILVSAKTEWVWPVPYVLVSEEVISVCMKILLNRYLASSRKNLRGGGGGGGGGKVQLKLFRVGI